MEVWAKSSRYGVEVSTFGRVLNPKFSRELFGTVRPDGYRQFSLNGRFVLGHILVLETFVGPRPSGLLGLHRDDVKLNNHVSNLYWGNYKENAHDRVANRRKLGRDASSSKLSRSDVVEIAKLLDEGVLAQVIADRFSTTVSTISAICAGKSWTWLTGRSSESKRSSLHPNSRRKLTKEAVLCIVRDFDGDNFESIAERFSVSKQTIRDVVTGSTWSHVTGVK